MSERSTDSEDSEGEELGLIRPKFIRELRNVLDEYPDDGQILKEMIQNAEDAGAKTIQIIADKRRLHGEMDKSTLKRHPHLVYFKGPALCVYNDAYFTDDDWKGIRMLHTSIKEKDPMKVGRFGLGFKSVFHLTDRLVILSGDRIMYMDPFKGEDRYCNSKRVSGMKGKELQTILTALGQHFGISQKSLQSGFKGTIFWFPLRNETSELSETLYSDKNMEDLMNSFRAEARSMMLFLKNIESIHLFSRDDHHALKETFNVAVESSCLQHVRQERKAFIDRLKEANGVLPQQSISNQTDLVIETVDHLKSTKKTERWIVVNFHPGVYDVTPELSALCTNPQLSYQPFVGVAMPMGGQDNFQSHLFCFLPLPLDTKSPTGLPVHVNGFFALSQNRRHIKWPTADQQHFKAHLEDSIRWNCLLVENIVPQAYCLLLLRLKELYIKQPDIFYGAWPDVTKVTDNWRPLLYALYENIVTKDFFYTQARGGSWISLSNSVLYSLPAHLEAAVAEVVTKVYHLNNENLVQLPRHVEESLQKLSLQTGSSISHHHASALARNCLSRLNTKEKLNLLRYLFTYHSAGDLLINLQLLPLQDGSFGTFERDQFWNANVYWCEEKLMEILPELENVLCSINVHPDIRKNLFKLAQTDYFTLKVLEDSSQVLPSLIESCLEKKFGKGNLVTLPAQSKWVEHVWNILSTSRAWSSDLTSFCDISLLPVTSGNMISLLPLDGVYVVCSVYGLSSLHKTLVSCLSKLGIRMLQTLPNYVTRHNQVLGNLVQYPSAEGIVAALRKVCLDEYKRYAAIQEFNSSATNDEKESLVTLLNNRSVRVKGIKLLIQHLNLFIEAKTNSSVSVDEINVIAPQYLPPVTLPRRYLAYNQVSRCVAVELGATEETLETLIIIILQLMERNKKYSREQITAFMKYFLGDKVLASNSHLLSLARKVQFVPMASGLLKTACELYDPGSQLLQELFWSEDRFPRDEFAQAKMLSGLKKLGLRTERDVKEDDLVATAQSIEYYVDAGERSYAIKKAEALQKLLVSYGHSIGDYALHRLSNIRCLPCLQKDQKCVEYPKDLPLMSQAGIVKPSEMCHSRHIRLVGSVVALMPPGISDAICQKLQVDSEMNVDNIFQHLRNTVQYFNSKQASQYQLVFNEIFHYLLQRCDNGQVIILLKEEDCIFIESEGRFAKPDRFWIQQKADDIDLRPYRFSLSREMSNFQELFLKCGSHLCQDIKLLSDVLEEIEEKHKPQSFSHPNCAVDIRLVIQILDVLKRTSEAKSGNFIIPVWHNDATVLHFRQAKDCTIRKGPWQLHGHVGIDNEDEIFFVHPDIPETTALALGALNMTERALTGAEELDFGYGQHEDLTDRLHNLLKDSYTDGFSVPKELIQNADDAGATELKLLLDERENQGARINLITEEMASLQGPALWAFNNAVFSDDDFKNIIKLGGGTKKDDAAKVGKFGLGFNSVYNLTDAPSFISRHVMAMFDPQVKYLRQPGLKLDFLKPVNRNLLKNMPEIFIPFQGVFGCKLDSDRAVNYEGTLFRLPLRTPEQAEESKLKSESYADVKQKEFLKMLLEKAGNLLMFTQNVKKLEVFHLPRHSDDPSCANRLLTVVKRSEHELLYPKIDHCNQNILQFYTQQWSTHQDIKILENIDIEIETTKFATTVCSIETCSNTTHWLIAWASGIDQSATIAKRCKHEKLLPLAGAAVSMKDGSIFPIALCPPGFYTSGHLFCFLPLPEEIVHMSLPVHLNATFALSSSRRGLLLKTEDDLGSLDADWNSALFADAICRAYLLLLETMQYKLACKNDYKTYFDLWPTFGSNLNLAANFYKHLVSDGNRVFPTSDGKKWISFQDACFLERDFRISQCGDIAMETLRTFWKSGENLVDVPETIYHQLYKSEQKSDFIAKVITHIVFYNEVFFPFIESEFWTKNKRDKLVHHALMQNDPVIQDLLQSCACIPCSISNVLQKPADLIHPHRLAASLFLESDGHFPQNSKSVTNTSQDEVDFCLTESLENLVQLGMVTDDLPESMLLERANSIGILCNTDFEQGVHRSHKLIEYLSVPKGADFRINSYSINAIEMLSTTEFLPIESKPDKWCFPWEGGNGERRLAAPNELFSGNLEHLVGCTAKILHSKFQNAFGVMKKEVFRKLSLKTEENCDDMSMIQLAMQQLLIIIDIHHRKLQTSTELTQTICSKVYSFLNNCCQTKVPKSDIISKAISDKKVVWTGTEFVLPSNVAFTCKFDCRPYLFQVEYPLKQYLPFCKAIGILEEFTKDKILLTIEEIHTQNEGQELSEEKIQLVSRVAQLLCECVKRHHTEDGLKDINIFLPNRSGYLQHVSHLCHDDCPWLTESETMQFVHDAIPPATASILGVQSKRMVDYTSISEFLDYFGQNERLTVRINRLLEGYTCDFSLFKELVQNADDAGATEIKFIKDFRNLQTKRVPVGWEALQGPALCVYNNKSFTSEDMKGIQSLGEGSKSQDILKTGKYGVGFNAVYHLTDVPSFWTREDDVKEVICAFDPNCKYVINATPQRPGIKFTNIERVKKEYPDMFSGYLGKAIDMTKPGTLFRLPLRTQQMADKSELRKDVITTERIKEMLDSFMQEVNICLLFLNNLRKISIYNITQKGELIPEYEVTMTVNDEASAGELKAFKNHLQTVSKGMKDKTITLNNISEAEAILSITLRNTRRHEEEWLVVSRFGFRNYADLNKQLCKEWQEEQFQLLPRGGVAVKIADKKKKKKGTLAKSKEYLAFCILPLPIETKLPVHVNGHFALDNETRRNIWVSKDDARTQWNEKIASEVIVPAYITAIKKAQDRWFGIREEPFKDRQELTYRLKQYHDLFPMIENAPSDFWKSMMKELYKQIAHGEFELFPVLQSKPCNLKWVPATKINGFPGYFHDLVAFFKSLSNRPKPASSCVALPFGSGTQTGNHSCDTQWSGKKAHQIQELLLCLNMNVLESPFYIFENFKSSGVDDVCDVSPANVIHFLKSAGVGNRDGCNLTGLPQHVKNTPLKTAGNVRELVLFVQYDESFLSKLEGLPLCLRQSENLYFFQSNQDADRPIATEFYNLLPGTADLFLHVEIYKLFLQFTEKTKTMIRKLDISTFAALLSQSLQETKYKLQQPVILDHHRLPSPHWLKLLWSFLHSQLGSVNGETEIQVRTKIEGKLSCLSEWSLIPVVKKDDSKMEQHLLYSIRDRQNVVDLQTTSDQSNPKLWAILKTLPLAFLDRTYLPKECFVTKIVASINHPTALLHALASTGYNFQLSPESAREILAYFNSCLTLLGECSESARELQATLKNLPFYTFIDGKIASIPSGNDVLCLSNDIPHEGLRAWSEKRCEKLVLLTKELIPMDLREFLCLKSPSTAEFYCEYMLPTFDILEDGAIKSHMKCIRDHFQLFSKKEMSDLASWLINTAFIKNNGRRCKACEFYSERNPVFQAMCCKDSFLPAPWNASKWSPFMKMAGIVHEVTNELFEDFALQLQHVGRSRLTDDIINKSNTLTDYLFEMKNLIQSGLLCRVKDICFIRPSQWLTGDEGKCLSEIAQPFCTERLVSFSESCSEQWLQLAWSSSCILHPDADPVQNIAPQLRTQILAQLEIPETIPKEKVFYHINNICATLAIDEDHKNFRHLNINTDLLKVVMTKVYEYLIANTTDIDRQTLKTLPIICDIIKMQMLFPETVVLDLRAEEAIEGYINRAPIVFGAFFPLFENLGAANQVTANHYGKVLFQLKTKSGDSVLHVEEIKIVKKAVEGLFRCLRSDSQEVRILTIEDLYLPSEDQCLWRSSELIFIDNPIIRTRFKEPPQGNKFFLGFKRLEIDCSVPSDEEVERLPDKYQMIWLSRIVKEGIPDASKDSAIETENSQAITDLIKDPRRIDLIIRLLYHLHRKRNTHFTKETTEGIIRSLQRISSREVCNLHTVLKLNNSEVEESRWKKVSFVDKCFGDTRSCVLYLDSDACRSMEKNKEAFFRSLSIAIEFVLNLELEKDILQHIFTNPDLSASIMDSDGYAHCDFSKVIEHSIFPQPGEFVPLSQHCYLDNSFSDFYVGEHVGFEVYDPQIDDGDSKETEPVIIFAIVLAEVTNENTDVPLLFKMYRIDLGPERGKSEVSVTKLYKFIRKTTSRKSDSKALVEYTGQSDTDVEEDVHPTDLAAVLKDIRRTLIEAWKLADEKDRMRVVKRLYLKWHPDKNKGNEAFCTQVVQKIQQYVDILKSGGTLKVDEDELSDSFPKHGYSSSSSSFFEHMHRRSQSHRTFFEEEQKHSRGASSHSHSSGRYEYYGSPTGSNPQPGEGRRWFRQAEADLNTAQEALQKCSLGYNWVCFKCQQAVEKALKAILYHRDSSDSNLRSHELVDLAKSVKDGPLLKLAGDLQLCVGSHTHMRYPDVLNYPKIPADIYTADQATRACCLADQALKRTRELLGVSAP